MLEARWVHRCVLEAGVPACFGCDPWRVGHGAQAIRAKLVDVDLLETERSRAGRFQDRLHQAIETIHLLDNVGRGFALLAAEGSFFEKLLGRALDDGEGVSNLVCEGGGKTSQRRQLLFVLGLLLEREE